MFGFLMICFVIAACLAEQTNVALSSKKNKKAAAEKNKKYYEDGKHQNRLVDNNHKCIISQGVVIDMETHQIIHNNYQDVLNAHANKWLTANKAPGSLKAVVTKRHKTSGLPVYNDVIWVENKTGKPYCLLYGTIRERNSCRFIKEYYYKCYYKNNMVQIHVRENKMMQMLYEDEVDCHPVLSKYLQWNYKIELTQEEFDKWDLSNSKYLSF